MQICWAGILEPVAKQLLQWAPHTPPAKAETLARIRLRQLMVQTSFQQMQRMAAPCQKGCLTRLLRARQARRQLTRKP